MAWRELARMGPGVRLGVAVGLLGLLVAPSAPAEEPEVDAAPHVELDRLLTLPSSLDYAVERRGGATRGEWRSRFAAIRGELEAAQAALVKAQSELEGLAEETETWQLTPPGAGDVSQAPLSYRLRQEIRRQREEVARAETRLRELDVEANLAGVPEEWRR